MKDTFDGLVKRFLDANIFLPEAIEILEKSMIAASLEQCRGNQCAASKQLGIHRNTLQRKLSQFGLESGRARARRKPVIAARGRKKKATAA